MTQNNLAEAAALSERIVAAWANHDADAFAAVFSDDGSMILPGVFCQGREQIRDFMAQAFAGPYRGTQVTGQPLALRAISDDVALIITRGGVMAAGETEVADERAIRASWLAVRRGGSWQLAAYQNSPYVAS